jgi:hypothetical protein
MKKQQFFINEKHIITTSIFLKQLKEPSPNHDTFGISLEVVVSTGYYMAFRLLCRHSKERPLNIGGHNQAILTWINTGMNVFISQGDGYSYPYIFIIFNPLARIATKYGPSKYRFDHERPFRDCMFFIRVIETRRHKSPSHWPACLHISAEDKHKPDFWTGCDPKRPSAWHILSLLDTDTLH